MIIFLVLLVFSSINQVVEHDTEMPRKRGTLRRGRTRDSGARKKENLGSTDGYITWVSMIVKCMIENWESRIVSEHLASGRNGGRISHY